MLNDTATKTLLASRTFWGGLLAVASGVLSLFGYTLAPSDQAAIMELVTGLGGTIGGAVAIYGRIVATRLISGSR